MPIKHAKKMVLPQSQIALPEEIRTNGDRIFHIFPPSTYLRCPIPRAPIRRFQSLWRHYGRRLGTPTRRPLGILLALGSCVASFAQPPTLRARFHLHQVMSLRTGDELETPHIHPPLNLRQWPRLTRTHRRGLRAAARNTMEDLSHHGFTPRELETRQMKPNRLNEYRSPPLRSLSVSNWSKIKRGRRRRVSEDASVLQTRCLRTQIITLHLNGKRDSPTTSCRNAMSGNIIMYDLVDWGWHSRLLSLSHRNG